MVLRGLQSLLGRLYDVSLDYDVYDFLVTDRRALARRDSRQRSARARRRAAARGDARDGAGRRACISTRACSSGSRRRIRFGELTEENLADYCTALEGVSHFVYSAWRLERRCAGVAPRARDAGRSRQICGDGLSGGRSARRHVIPPRCMRDCSIASTSMRAWSRSNTTAIEPRTAPRRTIAGGSKQVRAAGVKRASRRWCGSCASSIVWEVRPSCDTRSRSARAWQSCRGAGPAALTRRRGCPLPASSAPATRSASSDPFCAPVRPC